MVFSRIHFQILNVRSHQPQHFYRIAIISIVPDLARIGKYIMLMMSLLRLFRLVFVAWRWLFRKPLLIVLERQEVKDGIQKR